MTAGVTWLLSGWTTVSSGLGAAAWDTASVTGSGADGIPITGVDSVASTVTRGVCFGSTLWSGEAITAAGAGVEDDTGAVLLVGSSVACGAACGATACAVCITGATTGAGCSSEDAGDAGTTCAVCTTGAATISDWAGSSAATTATGALVVAGLRAGTGSTDVCRGADSRTGWAAMVLPVS